jgi:hypothetical protein
MKTIGMVFVLSLVMLAQTVTPAPPMTVSFSSSSATATNVSSKEIVLITVMVTYKEQSDGPVPAVHDLYFKQGGVPAGTMQDVVHPQTNMTITKVALTYVQFADGTSWGDGSDRFTQQAISRRPTIKDLLTNAMAAYQSASDQGLIDYLTKYSGTESGFAKTYLNMQKTSGTAAAVAQIQSRVNAAQGRSF